MSQRRAWREWAVFFLRGVAEQSRDAAVRAKQLQDLQADWRQRLVDQHARTRAVYLADHLFDTPVLTIPQAQKFLGITYHAAQNNLERLVATGILHPAGESSQGRMFAATEILKIVSA